MCGLVQNHSQSHTLCYSLCYCSRRFTFEKKLFDVENFRIKIMQWRVASRAKKNEKRATTSVHKIQTTTPHMSKYEHWTVEWNSFISAKVIDVLCVVSLYIAYAAVQFRQKTNLKRQFSTIACSFFIPFTRLSRTIGENYWVLRLFLSFDQMITAQSQCYIKYIAHQKESEVGDHNTHIHSNGRTSNETYARLNIKKLVDWTVCVCVLYTDKVVVRFGLSNT